MKYVQMTGLLLASLIAACGAAESADMSGHGQLSKELKISDEAGQNVVFIKLTSDDPGALAAYGEDSFTLLAFTTDETDSEGEAAPSAQTSEDASEAAEQVEDSLVDVKILSEQLAEGVTGYRLVDNLQANYRAPFAVVFMPSTSGSSYDCAVVSRLSTFNNVYATLQSRALTSTDPWVDFLQETDVPRSNPVEACDNGSYRVRARIERRQANDYSVSFHN